MFITVTVVAQDPANFSGEKILNTRLIRDIKPCDPKSNKGAVTLIMFDDFTYCYISDTYDEIYRKLFELKLISSRV